MAAGVYCTVSSENFYDCRLVNIADIVSSKCFRTLTGISIFCLADQHSAWVTRIFGGAAGNEGLGAFAISLDWNYVGSGGGAIGSLFTPLSTQLSLYAGCAVCMIAFCAVYATNTWKSQNFPFLSQQLFYENGTEYDQLLVNHSPLLCIFK
jgi:hypothetical protein